LRDVALALGLVVQSGGDGLEKLSFVSSKPGGRTTLPTVMATSHPFAPPPPVQLLQIGLGYWLSRGLHVAATLGIGDLLTIGPQSADELVNVTTRL
jgi:hypothetical protein